MKMNFRKIISFVLAICMLFSITAIIATAAESDPDGFSLKTTESINEASLTLKGYKTPYLHFKDINSDDYDISQDTFFYINYKDTANNAPASWFKFEIKNNSSDSTTIVFAMPLLSMDRVNLDDWWGETPEQAWNNGRFMKKEITVSGNSTVVLDLHDDTDFKTAASKNYMSQLNLIKQYYFFNDSVLNAGHYFMVKPKDGIKADTDIEVSLLTAPHTSDDIYPTGGWTSNGAPITIKGSGGSATPSVTSSFTLTKDFVVADGYTNQGTPITDIKDKVVANPTFKIAPYASFNRLTGKTDIPEFGASSYVIPVAAGTNSVTIPLPNFYEAGVGDYWYAVTEQPMDYVAGVAIDTTATRYLHVQVQWKGAIGGDMEVASVTLHANAPAADGTYNKTEKDTTGSDKTDGFTNTYGAGSLEITKLVTGNMGDPDKLFAVNVTLTAPTGQSVMGHIHYTGGFADENGTTAYTDAAPGEIAAGWNGSKTVTVYLKKDATVTFTNIPDGVTYEIAEDDYTGEGYEVAYAGTNTEDGDTVGTAKFTGTITDSLDEVTITNTKNVAIDVGVILDNAPFILLLVGSMAFFAVYFVTKRRKEEETY